MPSPMQLAVQNKIVSEVQKLINAGNQERPLYSLFHNIFLSYLEIPDLIDDLDPFRELVTTNILSNPIYQKECEIAALFVKNPTDDLYTEIERALKEKSPHYDDIKENRLLAFFAWAATNNDVDLLRHEGFLRLFSNYPKPAVWSIYIAILFGKHDFVHHAAQFLNQEHYSRAFSVAIATHDVTILEVLISSLRSHDPSFFRIDSEVVNKGKAYIASIGQDSFYADPLALAVRLQDPITLSFLLEQGLGCSLIRMSIHPELMPLDELHALLNGKPSYALWDGSVYYIDEYLEWKALPAVRLKKELDSIFPKAIGSVEETTQEQVIQLIRLIGNTQGLHPDSSIDPISKQTSLFYVLDNANMTRLLLQYGANVNHQNRQGETPLTIAAKLGHWEVIQLLIEFGANIELVDKASRTPFSYIKDASMQHRALLMVQEREKTKEMAENIHRLFVSSKTTSCSEISSAAADSLTFGKK